MENIPLPPFVQGDPYSPSHVTSSASEDEVESLEKHPPLPPNVLAPFYDAKPPPPPPLHPQVLENKISSEILSDKNVATKQLLKFTAVKLVKKNSMRTVQIPSAFMIDLDDDDDQLTVSSKSVNKSTPRINGLDQNPIRLNSVSIDDNVKTEINTDKSENTSDVGAFFKSPKVLESPSILKTSKDEFEDLMKRPSDCRFRSASPNSHRIRDSRRRCCGISPSVAKPVQEPTDKHNFKLNHETIRLLNKSMRGENLNLRHEMFLVKSASASKKNLLDKEWNDFDKKHLYEMKEFAKRTVKSTGGGRRGGISINYSFCPQVDLAYFYASREQVLIEASSEESSCSPDLLNAFLGTANKSKKCFGSHSDIHVRYWYSTVEHFLSGEISAHFPTTKYSEEDTTGVLKPMDSTIRDEYDSFIISIEQKNSVPGEIGSIKCIASSDVDSKNENLTTKTDDLSENKKIRSGFMLKEERKRYSEGNNLLKHNVEKDAEIFYNEKTETDSNDYFCHSPSPLLPLAVKGPKTPPSPSNSKLNIKNLPGSHHESSRIMSRRLSPRKNQIDTSPQYSSQRKNHHHNRPSISPESERSYYRSPSPPPRRRTSSPHQRCSKRVSLNERLEIEHGIVLATKIQPDFSRPPPGFKDVGVWNTQASYQYWSPAQHHNNVIEVIGQHRKSYGGISDEFIFNSGLAAGIDDGAAYNYTEFQEHFPFPHMYDQFASDVDPQGIPIYTSAVYNTNNLSYPVVAENEEIAADLLSQKVNSSRELLLSLEELKLAQDKERLLKREQRIATLRAQSNHDLLDVQMEASNYLPETTTDNSSTEREKRLSLSCEAGTEPNGLRYISLKPFSRKTNKRHFPIEVGDPVVETKYQVEKSIGPVSLPDASTVKPILVQLGFSLTNRKKKVLRYADGVLPGHGSPDISEENDNSPPPPPPPHKKSTIISSVQAKRRKRIRLTVFSTVNPGDGSDELPPPPPPPGSPKKLHTKQWFQLQTESSLRSPQTQLVPFLI